jgi:hypothetical protein
MAGFRHVQPRRFASKFLDGVKGLVWCQPRIADRPVRSRSFRRIGRACPAGLAGRCRSRGRFGCCRSPGRRSDVAAVRKVEPPSVGDDRGPDSARSRDRHEPAGSQGVHRACQTGLARGHRLTALGDPLKKLPLMRQQLRPPAHASHIPIIGRGGGKDSRRPLDRGGRDLIRSHGTESQMFAMTPQRQRFARECPSERAPLVDHDRGSQRDQSGVANLALRQSRLWHPGGFTDLPKVVWLIMEHLR